MSTFKLAIHALAGRRGAPSRSRRRTSHRFLSDYVPERFEPRVVPAQVAPLPWVPALPSGIINFDWLEFSADRLSVSINVWLTQASIDAGTTLQVGLVSYTDASLTPGDPGLAGQKLNDFQLVTLTPTSPSATLTVKLNPCGVQQVDAFVGDLIRDFTLPHADSYYERIFIGFVFDAGECPVDTERPTGDNGIGNGLDGQPPGDPKPNDIGDDHPGSPGWGVH